MKLFLSVLVVSLMLISPVSAQDSQTDAEKAMMDAWMAAATPGEAHRKLEPFVGEWNVTMRSWMAPGQNPTESTGSATSRWILGGRWLQQEYTGDFMGQPFHGIALTGYDNIRKRYVGTWMDNMSTSLMTTYPTFDGNVMRASGTMDDPMTGQEMPFEEVITIVSENEHRMEMFGPGPDGTMFRTMEIVYRRK